MTQALQQKKSGAALLANVVIRGDLSGLNDAELSQYYAAVCASVGLNALTQPFAYLHLDGKKVLYAKKECADQLRTMRGISIIKLDREQLDGLCTVVAYARDKDGREDADVGAVSIEGLKGAMRANAIMKAHTKAKRRVTLSICGLGGILDESELDDLHDAKADRAMGTAATPPVDDERAILKQAIEDQLRKNKASRYDAKVTFKGYFGVEDPDWSRIDIAAMHECLRYLEGGAPPKDAA